MTVSSIITANVPLLRPFLNSIRSGLIDSSMPKLPSAYELSILSRGHSHFKQSPGESSNTRLSTMERRHRGLSNSNTPLASNAKAPSTDLSLDWEDGNMSHGNDMIGIHL